MKKIINMHLHRYRKTGGDVCNSQRFKIGYTVYTIHSKYRDEKVLGIGISQVFKIKIQSLVGINYNFVIAYVY